MTSEEESTEEGDGTDALNFGVDVDDGVVGITPAQSRAAASAVARSVRPTCSRPSTVG